MIKYFVSLSIRPIQVDLSLTLTNWTKLNSVIFIFSCYIATCIPQESTKQTTIPLLIFIYLQSFSIAKWNWCSRYFSLGGSKKDINLHHRSPILSKQLRTVAMSKVLWLDWKRVPTSCTELRKDRLPINPFHIYLHPFFPFQVTNNYSSNRV